METPRNLWRVTIEDPEGGFFAGSGLSFDLALKAAQTQSDLSKVLRKGPGIWEMGKKPDL